VSTDITLYGAYGAVQQRREHSADPKYLQLTQEPPRTFQLAINYRSHGGIVYCAHSVIELITHFWPHAIDVLAREQGVVDGSKPVFFSGWDKDTVRYVSLLSALGTAFNLLSPGTILVWGIVSLDCIHDDLPLMVLLQWKPNRVRGPTM
jgi:hypothetical protein